MPPRSPQPRPPAAAPTPVRRRRPSPPRAAPTPGGQRPPLQPKAAVPPRRKGSLSAHGLRFAIVVSRFNEFITARLAAGAADALERLHAAAIEVIEVPGSFEIPAAARQAAASGSFDAIVCLGLILRGDTPHFDVISREVARGIGQSALESGLPHAFGVLTCETLEEAIQRAGLKHGNKGWEAALAAVEMARLFQILRAHYPWPAV